MGDSLHRLVGAAGTRGPVVLRAVPASPARAGSGCRPCDRISVAAGAPISAGTEGPEQRVRAGPAPELSGDFGRLIDQI